MSSDNEDDDADDQDASAADELNNTEGDDEMEDDDGFGDDFDDFEEGGEGDDFGDFDDGFQQGEDNPETTFDKPPEQPSMPAPSLGPVSEKYSVPGLRSLDDSCFAVMHRLTGCMRSLSLISKTSPPLKMLPLPHSLTLMRFTRH